MLCLSPRFSLFCRPLVALLAFVRHPTVTILPSLFLKHPMIRESQPVSLSLRLLQPEFGRAPEGKQSRGWR